MTFKNGDKFTIPVKYPEGLIIDLFAEGIVSGELQDARQPKSRSGYA